MLKGQSCQEGAAVTLELGQKIHKYVVISIVAEVKVK